MIGLALSGGGSRAIAFHLGCLRALNDIRLLDKVGVVSTISGGSLIGAYYIYRPQLTFRDFESAIRNFLRSGLEKKIALELANPKNFLPCLANFVLAQVYDGIELFRKRYPQFYRYPSRTDMFHKVLQRELFHELTLGSPRRHNIEFIAGACELRTGTAFRFSNRTSGGWRYGEMVANNIDVAFAVAASAAYPVFLPAFDRIWSFRKDGKETEHRVILTDGGVYDNLGVQVLEPGRNPEVSLHTFPCQYVIVCNAGYGPETGSGIPMGFITRVSKSFEVIHRRVQDSTMHRLHHLRKAGTIRGFALPYLGQKDERLPWKPSVLIPREHVIGYPTDFAPMPDIWIDKLSNRGEQLTRVLVSYYLRDLL